jgi:hypothetical protein
VNPVLLLPIGSHIRSRDPPCSGSRLAWASAQLLMLKRQYHGWHTRTSSFDGDRATHVDGFHARLKSLCEG